MWKYGLCVYTLNQHCLQNNLDLDKWEIDALMWENNMKEQVLCKFCFVCNLNYKLFLENMTLFEAIKFKIYCWSSDMDKQWLWSRI